MFIGYLQTGVGRGVQATPNPLWIRHCIIIGTNIMLRHSQVPQDLQDNISEIKSDVEELKLSTKSITTAIHKLSEQVTSCVKNINDKLTVLCKRIDCNDRRTSETLESIVDASDNLKTSFDQNTCQILNKTATIIDKVKVHCDSLNNNHVQPNEKTDEKNRPNEKSITTPKFN